MMFLNKRLALSNSNSDRQMRKPIIGITVNNKDESAASGKYECAAAYSQAVVAVNGLPMMLPQEPSLVEAYVAQCDGFIFTGGYDPDTRPFGDPLHPKARLIDPGRQAFELALLEALKEQEPDKPTLGVCLGMQLMALQAGGKLQQFLPDVLANPQLHENDNRHPVEQKDAWPTSLEGLDVSAVVSYHRQAVEESGQLKVLGKAPDGVIEMIGDPGRRFYVGVQWHPERGDDALKADGLIGRMMRVIQGMQ